MTLAPANGFLVSASVTFPAIDRLLGWPKAVKEVVRKKKIYAMVFFKTAAGEVCEN